MFSYDEYIMCMSTGLYYMSSKFNMIIQHNIESENFHKSFQF